MFQYIIVILIIAAAVGYALYSVFKSANQKDDASACGGCTGCDIKHEITKNRPGTYTQSCGGPK